MPTLLPGRIRATGKIVRECANGSDDITCGIYDSDNLSCCELSANMNPQLQRVRIAQRVPVRIHIDEVPEGFLLAAGTTCTVVVKPSEG